MKTTKASTAQAGPASSPQSIASGISRRNFLSAAAGAACFAGTPSWAQASTTAATRPGKLNLARVATPSSLTMTSENRIASLNDGVIPQNSADRRSGTYSIREDANSEDPGNWVDYTWSQPIDMDSVDLYWAIDPPRPDAPPGSGFVPLAAPSSYRILYWTGSEYKPVERASGYGTTGDTFNLTTFERVKTSRLRLEVTPKVRRGSGILEWRVFSSGPAPQLAPVVKAGIDRSVVMGGKTYLAGSAVSLQDLPGNNAPTYGVTGQVLQGNSTSR